MANTNTPCTECEKELSSALEALPSEWRDSLAKVLCQIREDKTTLDCNDVKDCETLTSLSNFSVVGSIVSITYKDEERVEVTRSFDFAEVINNSLNLVDPGCLATPSEWADMTFDERIQLIINGHFDCFCGGTTTTTTTTP